MLLVFRMLLYHNTIETLAYQHTTLLVVAKGAGTLTELLKSWARMEKIYNFSQKFHDFQRCLEMYDEQNLVDFRI